MASKNQQDDFYEVQLFSFTFTTFAELNELLQIGSFVFYFCYKVKNVSPS